MSEPAPKGGEPAAEGAIEYSVESGLSVEEFIDVLRRSTLAERRPVADQPRMAQMLARADLVVTARRAGVLVGVARALTDFCYCTYLSDLAVDVAFQRQGIGGQLIQAGLAEIEAGRGDDVVVGCGARGAAESGLGRWPNHTRPTGLALLR